MQLTPLPKTIALQSEADRADHSKVTAPASTSTRPLPRRLALLLVAMLMLSACTMRAIVGIDVEQDGSGTLEISMAFDEELRTLMEQEAGEPIDWSDPASFDESDTSFIEDLPEGATISAYSEDGFEGFTMSVEFADLEELDRLLSDTADDDSLPLVVTAEGDRFELSSTGPVFADSGLTEEEAEFMSPEMLSDLFDMQLRVDLPGSVVSTNADETTDDGVMVWHLDPLASEPILPAAVSEGGDSSILPILLGVAAVIVVGVAAVLVVRSRAGSQEPASATEDPDQDPDDQDAQATVTP